jgi:hypothetical protein
MKKENIIKIEEIKSSRYTKNGNRMWNITVSIEGMIGTINYKSVDFNYITPKEGDKFLAVRKTTPTGRNKIYIIKKL